MNIFGKKGEFIRPPQEEIDALPESDRKLFDRIETASLLHDKAVRATKDATDALEAAVIELRDTEELIRENLPKVSPIDAARQWINQQRANMGAPPANKPAPQPQPRNVPSNRPTTQHRTAVRYPKNVDPTREGAVARRVR